MNAGFLGGVVGALLMALFTLLGAMTWFTWKKHNDEKKSGNVTSFVTFLYRMIIGLDALCLIVSMVLLSTNWQGVQATTSPVDESTPIVESQPTVELCESELQDFQATTENGVTTFTFTTPVERQWAIDFGDGDHTQVLYTIDAKPFEITHTYSEPNTYTAMFLRYNPKADCQWRTQLEVPIP